MFSRFANGASQLSRRSFLRGLMGAGVALAVPGGFGRASTPSSDSVTISIIHTTDLHGRVLGDNVRQVGQNVGGFARCATQIRRWRRENPNTLLLDVGDTLQGTDVGWRTEGKIMTDCLNALDYDAWALGNHEFDWGIEPVHQALLNSKASVIGTNILLEGRHPAEFNQPDHPLSRIRPWQVFEVGGIRIGLMGFTTPGMPFWFPAEFLEGMTFLDCAGPARQGEQALRAMGIDCLVTFGHMGLRPDGDNQSNQVRAVIEACPTAAAYIGAHSHRLHQQDMINQVIYTQANFWGSHLGRLNLTFDRNSKKLIGRRGEAVVMDTDMPMDPVVVDLCRERLDVSAAALAQPVGRLAHTLSVESRPGRPSEIERLIATAMMQKLGQSGHPVDGVIHGQFSRQDFAAGDKTVRDLWPVMPFENFIITARLTPRQIVRIMEDLYNNTPRSLMGLSADVVERNGVFSVRRILQADGRPADSNRRYTIALNSWDAQSGGGRMMLLRRILDEPESRRTLVRVQTRQAMIEFFMDRQVVTREHLLAHHPADPGFMTFGGASQPRPMTILG